MSERPRPLFWIAADTAREGEGESRRGRVGESSGLISF